MRCGFSYIKGWKNQRYKASISVFAQTEDGCPQRGALRAYLTRLSWLSPGCVQSVVRGFIQGRGGVLLASSTAPSLIWNHTAKPAREETAAVRERFCSVLKEKLNSLTWTTTKLGPGPWGFVSRSRFVSVPSWCWLCPSPASTVRCDLLKVMWPVVGCHLIPVEAFDSWGGHGGTSDRRTLMVTWWLQLLLKEG